MRGADRRTRLLAVALSVAVGAGVSGPALAAPAVPAPGAAIGTAIGAGTPVGPKTNGHDIHLHPIDGIKVPPESGRKSQVRLGATIDASGSDGAQGSSGGDVSYV